jgi:hypothetical protein
MILLDNLVQYLIFIAMKDLSKTYDNIAILIYKLLVMFMSCFWTKIKLKVLLFLIQKWFYWLHIL